MDGVLADTEPIHEQAIGAFLAIRGKSLPPAEYAGVIGMDHHAFWTAMIERFGLHDSIDDCVQGYRTILLPRFAGLRAAPGALELVSALKTAHVPVAVASSSFRPVVETILDAIGLREAFLVVVSGEDVQRGKPEPDIYLLASERLGVAPDRCVAVEDSPHGVLAAITAGMGCLGIATRYASADQLRATRTVASLSEVTPADLAALAA